MRPVGINFGDFSVSHAPKKDAKQCEVPQQNIQKTHKTKYNPLYKPKYHKNLYKAVATVGIITASVFAGVKGKNKIMEAVNVVKSHFSSSSSKLSEKFPHLTKSASEFVQACKTPINKVTSFITKHLPIKK